MCYKEGNVSKDKTVGSAEEFVAGCLNLQKRSDIEILTLKRVDKEASSLVLFGSWYASEGDHDRNMLALIG